MISESTSPNSVVWLKSYWETVGRYVSERNIRLIYGKDGQLLLPKSKYLNGEYEKDDEDDGNEKVSIPVPLKVKKLKPLFLIENCLVDRCCTILASKFTLKQLMDIWPTLPDFLQLRILIYSFPSDMSFIFRKVERTLYTHILNRTFSPDYLEKLMNSGSVKDIYQIGTTIYAMVANGGLYQEDHKLPVPVFIKFSKKRITSFNCGLCSSQNEEMNNSLSAPSSSIYPNVNKHKRPLGKEGEIEGVLGIQSQSDMISEISRDYCCLHVMQVFWKRLFYPHQIEYRLPLSMVFEDLSHEHLRRVALNLLKKVELKEVYDVMKMIDVIEKPKEEVKLFNYVDVEWIKEKERLISADILSRCYCLLKTAMKMKGMKDDDLLIMNPFVRMMKEANSMGHIVFLDHFKDEYQSMIDFFDQKTYFIRKAFDAKINELTYQRPIPPQIFSFFQVINFEIIKKIHYDYRSLYYFTLILINLPNVVSDWHSSYTYKCDKPINETILTHRIQLVWNLFEELEELWLKVYHSPFIHEQLRTFNEPEFPLSIHYDKTHSMMFNVVLDVLTELDRQIVSFKLNLINNHNYFFGFHHVRLLLRLPQEYIYSSNHPIIKRLYNRFGGLIGLENENIREWRSINNIFQKDSVAIKTNYRVTLNSRGKIPIYMEKLYENCRRGIINYIDQIDNELSGRNEDILPLLMSNIKSLDVNGDHYLSTILALIVGECYLKFYDDKLKLTDNKMILSDDIKSFYLRRIKNDDRYYFSKTKSHSYYNHFDGIIIMKELKLLVTTTIVFDLDNLMAARLCLFGLLYPRMGMFPPFLEQSCWMIQTQLNGILCGIIKKNPLDYLKNLNIHQIILLMLSKGNWIYENILNHHQIRTNKISIETIPPLALCETLWWVYNSFHGVYDKNGVNFIKFIGNVLKMPTIMEESKGHFLIHIIRMRQRIILSNIITKNERISECKYILWCLLDERFHKFFESPDYMTLDIDPFYNFNLRNNVGNRLAYFFTENLRRYFQEEMCQFLPIIHFEWSEDLGEDSDELSMEFPQHFSRNGIEVIDKHLSCVYDSIMMKKRMENNDKVFRSIPVPPMRSSTHSGSDDVETTTPDTYFAKRLKSSLLIEQHKHRLYQNINILSSEPQETTTEAESEVESFRINEKRSAINPSNRLGDDYNTCVNCATSERLENSSSPSKQCTNSDEIRLKIRRMTNEYDFSYIRWRTENFRLYNYLKTTNEPVQMENISYYDPLMEISKVPSEFTTTIHNHYFPMISDISIESDGLSFLHKIESTNIYLRVTEFPVKYIPTCPMEPQQMINTTKENCIMLKDEGNDFRSICSEEKENKLFEKYLKNYKIFFTISQRLTERIEKMNDSDYRPKYNMFYHRHGYNINFWYFEWLLSVSTTLLGSIGSCYEPYIGLHFGPSWSSSQYSPHCRSKTDTCISVVFVLLITLYAMGVYNGIYKEAWLHRDFNDYTQFLAKILEVLPDNLMKFFFRCWRSILSTDELGRLSDFLTHSDRPLKRWIVTFAFEGLSRGHELTNFITKQLLHQCVEYGGDRCLDEGCRLLVNSARKYYESIKSTPILFANIRDCVIDRSVDDPGGFHDTEILFEIARLWCDIYVEALAVREHSLVLRKNEIPAADCCLCNRPFFQPNSSHVHQQLQLVKKPVDETELLKGDDDNADIKRNVYRSFQVCLLAIKLLSYSGNFSKHTDGIEWTIQLLFFLGDKEFDEFIETVCTSITDPLILKNISYSLNNLTYCVLQFGNGSSYRYDTFQLKYAHHFLLDVPVIINKMVHREPNYYLRKNDWTSPLRLAGKIPVQMTWTKRMRVINNNLMRPVDNTMKPYLKCINLIPLANYTISMFSRCINLLNKFSININHQGVTYTSPMSTGIMNMINETMNMFEKFHQSYLLKQLFSELKKNNREIWELVRRDINRRPMFLHL
ncbi:hypothetical protein SNEBB_009648 [Seison nebaliae]|nr:hypothetical protein SNEBB_009648 [Seison nebaliae]